MGRNSKALLDLEGKNSSLSSIESTLLVCKKNDLLHSQTTKPHPPDGKTVTSSVPKSQDKTMSWTQLLQFNLWFSFVWLVAVSVWESVLFGKRDCYTLCRECAMKITGKLLRIM